VTAISHTPVEANQGSAGRPLPRPSGEHGLQALRAMLRGGVLAGLSSLHHALGDVFELPLGQFSPIVMAGPEASRFVLVEAREQLNWRPPEDPVTRLLGSGLLVLDGDEHWQMRRSLAPPLRKAKLIEYTGDTVGMTDWLIDSWPAQAELDLLAEMRKLALVILMTNLFGVDVRSDLQGWIAPLQRLLRYISPGLWLFAPWLPRPGYAAAIADVDRRLYSLIEARRAAQDPGDDLIGTLIKHASLSDQVIRDQLLTMLIAGHDTTTAHLAWTLHLIARQPAVAASLAAEIDRGISGAAPDGSNIDNLPLLDQVIRESLRLYPPIHIGNRIVAEDLEFQGYRIPAGRRLVYSIYLTQRHPEYWPEPEIFRPERHTAEARRGRPPYTQLPFGGGRRTCIGMAFAEWESRVVLARLLQRVHLGRPIGRVHAHMGATLEPAAEVRVEVSRR
jgi:cytochrome P450